MRNRIISIILAVCTAVLCISPAFAADDEYPKREYYSVKVVHSTYYETDYEHNVDFMILSESSDTSKSKVYIKAEDFSYLTTDTGFYYEYNQTLTECALVCNELRHVMRFRFDSTDVSVFYACNTISYKAPYKILYEDGVVWLPYEFLRKLMHLQSIPLDDYLHISSMKYNPLTATTVIHEQIRDYGFDEIDEIGKSKSSYYMGLTSAKTASLCNKLLSFEPTEWGSALACVAGQPVLYDAQFAEDIGKVFVLPSETEIKKTDTFLLKKFAGSAKAYDKLMTDNVLKGTAENKVNMNIDKFNDFIKKHPKLGKLKSVEAVGDLINDPKSKKTVNDLFVKLGNFYDKGGEKAAKVAGYLVELFKVVDCYKVYKNKCDRAVASLKQYAEKTKYEEKIGFKYSYTMTEHPFLAYFGGELVNKAEGAFNSGVLSILGPIGAQAKAMGKVWSFVSGIGPLKTGISAVDKQTLSDYAIRYQDDALGLYYDCYNKCLAENGANEKTLDELVNALYAYMKFSYIARDSSAASHKSVAETIIFETETIKKQNALDVSAYLEKNNDKIAEMLTYLEEDLYTPSDAENDAKKPDDSEYVTLIRGKGTPIDKPGQDTEPVLEFPDFPGAKGIDYISEEEAIELADRTTNRLNGGFLGSEWGKAMTESMGIEGDVYTYEVIDFYVEDGDMAYVVQMYTAGRADAMYFVSVLGNEVWMGNPSSSEESGYYVFKDLDLLHANIGDIIGAIGSLTNELRLELQKEYNQKQQN